MENQDLVKQLEVEFEKIKKEHGIKASFKELDKEFFFKDFIRERGFIGQKLHRDLSHRISSLFQNWVGAIQSWIVPNNGSYVSMVESNSFTEEDKQELQKTLYKFMDLISENTVLGFEQDKKKQGIYFDKALETWKDHKEPLKDVLKKINNNWKNT